MDAGGFLALVRRYTYIEQLTPAILREFIDKIVVHHKEQVFGETVQKVEIYYNMIGYIELPKLNQSKQENYQKVFGRKETDRSA